MARASLTRKTASSSTMSSVRALASCSTVSCIFPLFRHLEYGAWPRHRNFGSAVGPVLERNRRAGAPPERLGDEDSAAHMRRLADSAGQIRLAPPSSQRERAHGSVVVHADRHLPRSPGARPRHPTIIPLQPFTPDEA